MEAGREKGGGEGRTWREGEWRGRKERRQGEGRWWEGGVCGKEDRREGNRGKGTWRKRGRGRRRGRGGGVSQYLLMKQLMLCFNILSTLSFILDCEGKREGGREGGREVREGERERKRSNSCTLWIAPFSPFLPPPLPPPPLPPPPPILTFSASSNSAILAVDSTLTLEPNTWRREGGREGGGGEGR